MNDADMTQAQVNNSASQLVLASASPRRSELLQQLGLQFRSLAVAVDETPNLNEDPERYVRRLAQAKAMLGWEQDHSDLPVLGADTAVVVDDEILGKPADRGQAVEMLERLAGRSHHVFTGVALVRGEQVAMRVARTRVSFRELSRAEIETYWETGEPADKAGGYAIQGLGAIFVRRIDGSYSAVMGLPLFETADLLETLGMPVLGIISAMGQRPAFL